MKRYICAVITVVLGVIKMHAYDYAYNNMFFNLDNATRTATLTYNTTSYNSYKGEINIPEIISGPKGVDYTVTSIGENALRNSTSVTKVTIPNTITGIGSHAFDGCTSITTVSVPQSVTFIGSYAFSGCTNLAVANLSDGLQSIGSYAFQNTVLKSIDIPTTVTTIGEYCFYANSTTGMLERAFLPESVTEIPTGCFKSQRKLADVKWSSSLKCINSSAFYQCAALKSISLGSVIETIGSDAFNGCTTLSTLTIPASLTSIGTDAFANTGISTLTYADGCTTTLRTYATNTTKLTLPNTLTSVASSAFYNFSKLADVTMHEGVTTIGSSSFEGCSALLLAHIPSTMETISNHAFYGCSNLKVVEFPGNLTTIGERAFYDCGSLASLTVTKSITSIGQYAFSNSGISLLTYEEGVTETLPTYADKTTKVILPSSVTSIGDNSFEDFTRLSDIVFPQNLTTIGQRAFYGCISLNELTIRPQYRSIGADAFHNSGVSKLTYEDGCTKALRTYANKTKVLVLPSTLKEISAYAFYGFTELTGVALPERLDTIGANAFNGCSQLATLTLPASVSVIGADAFANSALAYLIYAKGTKKAHRTYSTNLISVVIPNTVIEMPQDVFSGCTKLENIFISDLELWNFLFHDKTTNPIPTRHKLYYGGNVLTNLNADFMGSVMPYAFAQCKGLKTVSLSASVTGISNNAFEDCPDLEAVVVGTGVQDIGQSAFKSCKALASVTLTPSVKTIGNSAFEDCVSLNNLHFGGSETSIGSSAFKGCINLTHLRLPATLTTLGASAFSGCTSILSADIPVGVTAIANYTFEKCTSLQSVTFGENTQSLGSHAFENCDALQNLQLPDAVKTIGDYCFNDCDSIRYAYLGSSLTSVGSYSFAKCKQLLGIYCSAQTPPTGNSNTFSDSDPAYIELYVPEASVSSYSSKTPWSSLGKKGNLETAAKYVQKILLPKTVLLMKPGETETLTVDLMPADATNTKVNWSSANTAIAEIFRGEVYANKAGTTTITAKADDGNGATATCTVVVDDYTPVSSVHLSETSLTLREGREAYLTATVSPEKPTNGSVTWSSSNKDVAMVSKSGKVTAMSAGTATITCSADYGKGATASCNVTVKEAVSPVPGDVNEDGKVDATDVNIVTRMVMEIMDAGTYSAAFDVNGDGDVSVSDIAAIVSTVMGDKSTDSSIKVFALEQKNIQIDTLEQRKLEYVVIPRSAKSAISWTSSNPAVATVDVNGVVTGVAFGKSVIYANIGAEFRDSCVVEVKKNVQKTFPDWQSTNTAHSSTSSYTYEFEAEKGWTMSFDWTVSSESSYDYLIVTRNGTEILKKSGEDSGKYTYTFTSDGKYTVVVKYTKDSSQSSGSDMATIKNFTVEGYTNGEAPVEPLPDNSGFENGHEYVDLGLSVKWATCNVGASKPEEYGDYFAWGETTTKSTYGWSTYKWCKGSSSTMTKYCKSSSYGTVDNKTVLDKEDDAASVNWGGSWRMPTRAEQDELRYTGNCTWTWTTMNGVNGYKVVSKKNGNSIFLPAAGYRDYSSLNYAGSYGYYWSSSLYESYSDNAYHVGFGSSYVGWYGDYRGCGQSVRAVCHSRRSPFFPPPNPFPTWGRGVKCE